MASFTLVADDRFEAFLNGERCRRWPKSRIATRRCHSYARGEPAGRAVRNVTALAKLIAAWRVTLASGKVARVVTDASWRVSRGPGRGGAGTGWRLRLGGLKRSATLSCHRGMPWTTAPRRAPLPPSGRRARSGSLRSRRRGAWPSWRETRVRGRGGLPARLARSGGGWPGCATRALQPA